MASIVVIRRELGLIKNKKNAHVSGRRRKCPQNMNFPFTLGKIGALHQGENLELYTDQVCRW